MLSDFKQSYEYSNAITLKTGNKYINFMQMKFF